MHVCQVCMYFALDMSQRIYIWQAASSSADDEDDEEGDQEGDEDADEQEDQPAAKKAKVTVCC